MPRHLRFLTFLASIFFSISVQAGVTECKNEWMRPSSQTMSMDSSISFALTDYKNGERHFSVKQDQEHGAEIYYLKGAVLVKGYSQDQLAQIPPNALFMMPMAFAVPIMILAEAAPKGPCNVEVKTPISIQLPGEMRLQDRKLTSATGQLLPSTPRELSYELDVSIVPPAPNKTSVRYSGTMSFAPQQEAPPDDSDVTGYIVVTRTRPFSVAGSAGVPATLGKLKRFLASVQTAPNTALQGQTQ